MTLKCTLSLSFIKAIHSFPFFIWAFLVIYVYNFGNIIWQQLLGFPYPPILCRVTGTIPVYLKILFGERL